jgi:hypothetical protein
VGGGLSPAQPTPLTWRIPRAARICRLRRASPDLLRSVARVRVLKVRVELSDAEPVGARVRAVGCEQSRWENILNSFWGGAFTTGRAWLFGPVFVVSWLVHPLPRACEDCGRDPLALAAGVQKHPPKNRVQKLLPTNRQQKLDKKQIKKNDPGPFSNSDPPTHHGGRRFFSCSIALGSLFIDTRRSRRRRKLWRVWVCLGGWNRYIHYIHGGQVVFAHYPSWTSLLNNNRS